MPAIDQMALGAIQAIKEAGLPPGKDITIIGMDAVKGMFQAIIAGEANTTIECNPLLGPQAVQAMPVNLPAGKKLPARIWTIESQFDATNAEAALPTRQYDSLAHSMPDSERCRTTAESFAVVLPSDGLHALHVAIPLFPARGGSSRGDGFSYHVTRGVAEITKNACPFHEKDHHNFSGLKTLSVGFSPFQGRGSRYHGPERRRKIHFGEGAHRVHPQVSGEILLEGKPIHSDFPRRTETGNQQLYQEVNLCPNLT